MSFDGVEVESGPQPTGTVIWLHGLGADGHDFEPIVPHLVHRGERALRFIFPHAPRRPVTFHGGLVMRAWYDLAGLDRRLHEDEDGIRASYEIITSLIRRENRRGIATRRIVLGGFSQGGAMSVYAGTRYPETLAGIVALSCYMLLSSKFVAERTRANQETPIFLAHGKQDPMVAPFLGIDLRQQLEKTGYRVRWHSYLLGHGVCPEEICDIATWLREILPDPDHL
jgi:phospholipase/carboxylesterase